MTSKLFSTSAKVFLVCSLFAMPAAARAADVDRVSFVDARRDAYDNGYRDGYKEGLNDGRARHRNDPYGESRWRNADHYYDRGFGSREFYRVNYRHGFENGYAQGYSAGWRCS